MKFVALYTWVDLNSVGEIGGFDLIPVNLVCSLCCELIGSVLCCRGRAR